MPGETLSADQEIQPQQTETQPAGAEQDCAVRADQPPYLFQAAKLSSLFDSDENDEALFARLKLERSFYRSFSRCGSVEEFTARIADTVTQLGFSDYSFVGLGQVNNPSGDTGVVPAVLLASYDDRARESGSVMFQARADNTRNRHLSMVYHFIASLAEGCDFLDTTQERYLLVGSAGVADYYLAPCGFPERSCRISTCTAEKTGKNTVVLPSKQGLHQMDILASAIEVTGKEVFPAALELDTPRLESRPLRLLTTMAHKDVNLRGAAKMLCLSTDTVNKHMAAAKKALGTSTIAGTVWVAVKRGILSTT